MQNISRILILVLFSLIFAACGDRNSSNSSSYDPYGRSYADAGHGLSPYVVVRVGANGQVYYVSANQSQFHNQQLNLQHHYQWQNVSHSQIVQQSIPYGLNQSMYFAYRPGSNYRRYHGTANYYFPNNYSNWASYYYAPVYYHNQQSQSSWAYGYYFYQPYSTWVSAGFTYYAYQAWWF